MHGKLAIGRRVAYGLAALAITGMTLSTPAEAQSWKAQYGKGHWTPHGAVYGKPGVVAEYGGYVARPRYPAYPAHAYGHHGYGHYPRHHAYPGYAYPGYAHAYPGYGYPYGYYRKKRSNHAAIAAAMIGGMALGAILASQGRHHGKAYYKRRYR